jgi:GT2 family glycosyltransferase
MAHLPRPTVSIVTYHSAAYILDCLRSVFEQTLPPEEVFVIDNASEDGSADLVARSFGSQVKLIRSARNTGFSAPHNLAIRSSKSKYILILNPDTRLESGFLEHLTLLLETWPGLGSATGKLRRMPQDFSPITEEAAYVLDSTGMYFLPNQRHADRGAGQPDIGQYENQQLVFGTTAAAGFYRRSMLEDIAIQGEFFDEGFFVYREDVDLAWRSILYGWSCGYEPKAIGYHVRFGIPERRHLLPSEVNYHSVKNRFLLRVKNMPLGMYARHFGAISFRDLLVIGYALLREHHSLDAFRFLHAQRRRYLAYRQEIASRRRTKPGDVEKWIGWKARAFPFSPPASPI